MNALLTYLRDTKGELKHVSWPTQKQTVIYTVLVITISIITSLYIGLLDHLFVKGLEFLLT
jgi:preprotein translocase subunit SecE